MKLIKVNNLLNMFGQPDYKGLDISKFVAGSQVYPAALDYCLIATEQTDIPVNADITVITEEEYTTARNAVIAETQKQAASVVDRLSAVEVAMANMMGV